MNQPSTLGKNWKWRLRERVGKRLLHASMTLRIPLPEHGVNCTLSADTGAADKKGIISPQYMISL